jgi:hypothetical protein
VFWINPPLAVVAAGVLLAFAPENGRIQRRFDVIGAAILASALGRSPGRSARSDPPELGPPGTHDPNQARCSRLSSGSAFVGLAVYAASERRSEHPITPPRLVENRAFLGLNVAIKWSMRGFLIMFFLPPIDLVDRRGLPASDAGLAFLPFTLGAGLLSNVFGGLADKIGPRPMLIAGPAGAALAYLWMALGREESLTLGIIGPMTLLGLSFAVLVAPLTASVMSSVDEPDEGLASHQRCGEPDCKLAGVALAAGLASFASGYQVGLAIAATSSIVGALTALITLTAARREKCNNSPRNRSTLGGTCNLAGRRRCKIRQHRSVLVRLPTSNENDTDRFPS